MRLVTCAICGKEVRPSHSYRIVPNVAHMSCVADSQAGEQHSAAVAASTPQNRSKSDG